MRKKSWLWQTRELLWSLMLYNIPDWPVLSTVWYSPKNADSSTNPATGNMADVTSSQSWLVGMKQRLTPNIFIICLQTVYAKSWLGTSGTLVVPKRWQKRTWKTHKVLAWYTDRRRAEHRDDMDRFKRLLMTGQCGKAEKDEQTDITPLA